MTNLDRRQLIALGLAGLAIPKTGFAAAPRSITWDDLIPPGVPYSEIIGEGELDEVNDTWNPIYDANATKLNKTLNGAYIRMPGFIIPLDFASRGVTSFLLVPYVGACIHVPPPPANQLVLVSSKVAWPSDQLWDPVWAHGTFNTAAVATELADVGYIIDPAELTPYTG